MCRPDRERLLLPNALAAFAPIQAKRLASSRVENAPSQAGEATAGLATQVLMLVLRLGQLVIFCHVLFSNRGGRDRFLSGKTNVRRQPLAWSFDLLQHTNLLLIRVSVVSPDHIGPGGVAPNFVHHADPARPVPPRPRARAANGSVLWGQSDPITSLQCHCDEQPP
jgi:hypothetical protein